MIKAFVCALFCAYAVLIPAPAHAYFLLLVGAGPTITVILIGLITALFSAVYLVIYKIRRSMRKRNGEDAGEEDEDDDNAAQSS